MKLFLNYHANIVAVAAIVCCHTSGVLLVQVAEAQPSNNIGEGSVVRQGKDNVASGEFCTVGGGELNIIDTRGPVNFKDKQPIYSVIGGGKDNRGQNLTPFLKLVKFGDKAVLSGGAENRMFSANGSTISGGTINLMRQEQSVITGGIFNTANGEEGGGTISGGGENFNVAGGTVITGGISNSAGTSNFVPGSKRRNGVVTGGFGNASTGLSSVVVGGKGNSAEGDYSIAFGTSAIAIADNSMVINLIDTGNEPLFTEEIGLFLVNAKSFRFQVGSNGSNGKKDLSTVINEDNIGKLIDLLG